MTFLNRIAFAPLLAAACVACSPTGPSGLAQSAEREIPNPADLQSIIAAARADAGKRSGIDAAQTQLLGGDSVTWSDGSLGCPEPGRLYTQALVPGWRIRIEAAGAAHEYHASRRGQWLWCPPERVKPPAARP